MYVYVYTLSPLYLPVLNIIPDGNLIVVRRSAHYATLIEYRRLDLLNL